MDLLRSQGHEVALFSMTDERGEQTPYDHHFVSAIDFKGRVGLFSQLEHAGHAIYSTESRRKLRRMIRDFRPDVAHVRNIYHHLSPSILWELKKQGVPVLYHLNDFKLLCPTYNLVSGGKSCEACKGGAFWHALGQGCYPGLGARATLATEAYFHRFLRTYRTCVDLFLAPSEFVRTKFIEHGWDESRFEVLPHFQCLPEVDMPGGQTGPILYVGRLSSEKGADDVVHAMRQLPDLRLIIAGDGPEKRSLQNLARSLGLSNVEFAGQVGAKHRDALIAESRFTVMPSHAYETLGKTILESYAQSRAVVASDIGSRRELVRHGETGFLYNCGDINGLAQAVRRLASDPQLAMKMGAAGRELVRQRYSPPSHYETLVRFYEDLIKRSALRRDRKSWSPRSGLMVTTLDRLPTFVRRAETKATANPHLRVAFVGGRGVVSKYSGIEAYYEEVGKRLAAAGHEVTIYCRNYFTPKLKEHNGMRIVRLPTLRTKHSETVIHTFLSTMHAVTQRYDLIHYHALGPALFAMIPRMFGVKTAVTVQGLDWQRKKWGPVASTVLRWGELASVRLPSATMVVSKVLQKRYLDMHHAEASYIPNGGLLREKSTPHKIFEWGLEPGKYVLFLGRFSPEKCCHLLVEAFEQIETDAKLVMAGASSYCDEYSRELRTHASEKIKILDWVSGDTLDELLTNAMIFVLPSDMEGLSLALLDAMGAGLCVLTSDVPENREVVEGAGFTFQAGNSADLAERLKFLISNPAVRESAGRTAKKRIEAEYQWSKVALAIESHYCKILGLREDPIPKKASGGNESAQDAELATRIAG